MLVLKNHFVRKVGCFLRTGHIYTLNIWLFSIQHKTLIVEACFFFPNSMLKEIAQLHRAHAWLCSTNYY